MSGMIVLSDTLQGGNKVEKTTKPRGYKTAESSENPSTGFAEVLSSFRSPQANPKGQHSKAQGNLEDGQGGKDVDPLKVKEPETTQDYSFFSVPFFSQALSQSDFPAGKEANSGNVVSPENSTSSTDGSLAQFSGAVSGNVGLAVLNLLSQVSNEVSDQSGMMAQEIQGLPPQVAELDKYKQIIVNLLEELSGEINDVSAKTSSLNIKSIGIDNLSQEMAKVLQGWLTNTHGEVLANNQVFKVQNGIQELQNDVNTWTNSVPSVLDEKLAALLTTLTSQLNRGKVEAGSSSQLEMYGMNQTENVIGNSNTPGSMESYIDKSKANDTNSDKMTMKDSEPIENSFQTLDVKKTSDNKNFKSLQEPFKEGIQKGDNKPTIESTGVKEISDQNLSLGLGSVNSVSTTSVTEGKTASIPIWDQISTLLGEQVMNRSQDLKHLDIQLHPEELGKIQIDLHWENGQVHLQVQASETSTSQLLQNHLSDLRQSISNQGVNCGMLQMGQGGERQQNSRQDDNRRPLNQNRQLNEEDESTLGFSPITREAVGGNELNRLNVTA